MANSEIKPSYFLIVFAFLLLAMALKVLLEQVIFVEIQDRGLLVMGIFLLISTGLMLVWRLIPFCRSRSLHALIHACVVVFGASMGTALTSISILAVVVLLTAYVFLIYIFLGRSFWKCDGT